MSGNSETISVSVWGNTVSIWSITVVSVEGIGISISTSLSVASIACGLAVGGAHSWPVGVGVEEGGGGISVVSIEGISISLGGDSDSNTSGNLRRGKYFKTEKIFEKEENISIKGENISIKGENISIKGENIL